MKYFLFFFLTAIFLNAQETEYLQVKPKPGDGIATLFKRYEIPYTKHLINKFLTLNKSRLDRKKHLFLTKKYFLPISLRKFNGKTIRSSINNYNYAYAKSIEEYNDRLYKKGVKPNDFRKDKQLWVPLWDIEKIAKHKKKKKLKVLTFPIFGEKYKTVKQKDDLLDGCVYYLISGHGGPDPGAIGNTGKYELHEDEYAYDITIRLARKLLEHSATVYLIVQDPKDGIRDYQYLNNSNNEYYYGGDTIPVDQKQRLAKRVEIVNKLYRKHKNTARLQRSVVIHVDSRSYGKRIDIFFYHALGSKKGKSFATTLMKTIEKNYKAAQPNRGYFGNVSARNLYVLRKLLPVTSFIELGNIRNSYDRLRLIIVNNRQAIANWLCEGIIRDANN